MTGVNDRVWGQFFHQPDQGKIHLGVGAPDVRASAGMAEEGVARVEDAKRG